MGSLNSASPLLPYALKGRPIRIGLVIAGDAAQRAVAVNRFFVNARRIEGLSAQWSPILHCNQRTAFLARSPFRNVIRGQFVRLNKVCHGTRENEQRIRTACAEGHQHSDVQQALYRTTLELWLPNFLHTPRRSSLSRQSIRGRFEYPPILDALLRIEETGSSAQEA